MSERDKRLAILIIALLLLIPVAFAGISFLVGFLINQFA